MKVRSFLPKSLAGRIAVVFVTFAIGVAASTLFGPGDLSPTVSLQIPPPTTFDSSNVQTVLPDIEVPDSPVVANVVQSSIVDFPANGRVIVRSVEEVGKFPQMLFLSQKTGKVLLRSSIEDERKWLVPNNDTSAMQPDLRYRVVRSPGFKGPMIMSVGLFHGVSDDLYYLTVFGEVNGEIRRLNQQPFLANIQGGYFLGYLNKKLGYGLAVWDFIWGDDIRESHYSEHKYEIEIYTIQDGQLKQTLRKVSRKMYDSEDGANSLLELGIRAVDQRSGVPEIKESLR